MFTKMAAVALAVCAACGGGGATFTTGSASVSGTINGQPMAPRDAVSAVLQVGSNSVGEILIGSYDTICAKINAHQEPRNSQAVAIEIGNRSSTSITAPTATGTYPVVLATDHSHTGLQASLQFLATDASCNLITNIDAVAGGTVTLTRIDATGYAGTFDVTFGTSHVTGSFTSAQCAPLTTASTATCI
jgi:hypothetical protein